MSAHVDHDKTEGDRITVGDTEGVGIAIGTGASVMILGDVHYYPIRLRAPLREVFDPLLEDRTALFGGRKPTLARIADFVQDPTGGYLVVTAPAGFGKTALMANLVSGTPEAFAYHLFTSTYVSDGLSEDFFLRNVVEQLAQWHGHVEPLPERLHELSALYHKFIDGSLEHTQVLVLDGLDEVTTWKLKRYLSRRLPPNLHIILTVRDVGQDWAAEYGLPADQTEHLPLGGLTRDEVAQVLQAAGEGAVVFAYDPALLDEVIRVSAYQADEALGADPFYVRLLAEDAAEGLLTSENITEQPQGLEAYLDTWWQEVKELAGEQPVRDLFGTLTVALGPIRRADLGAINPSLVDKWAEDFFDDVLRQVRRWVVGNAERGYALAHPHLRQYMRTRIKTEPYLDRLLAYCASWQEHHSAYALRYYAQHLAEAGQIDALCTLVESQDWTFAKYVDTPWVDSLVQDLQLASASGAGRGIEAWPRSMAYQLRRALIEDLMARPSGEVVVFMAELGRVDQALHYAKRHPWRSFQLYHRIAEVVAENQPDKALNILLQSIRLFDRGSLLNQYGARLVVAKIILESEEILAKVPSAAQQARNLVKEAERMQPDIPGLDRQSYQARYSCPMLVLTGRPSEAKRLADSLTLANKSQALCRISLALPPGHPEKIPLLEHALSILESAERNAETITREVQAVVTLLPHVDKRRQAQFVQTLVSLENELHSVSEALPRPSWSRAVENIACLDLEKAKDILFNSKWNSGWRGAWPALIRQVALVDPKEALDIAENQYSHHVGYSSVIADIVRIVAVQFGNTVEAEELINKYSKRLSGSFGCISEAYLALAEAYLAQGNRRKAEEVFDKQVFVISDQGIRRGRNDLLVAMVARSSILDSCDVEAVLNRMRDIGDGRFYSAERLLGYLAARRGKIDFIETHRLGPKAQIDAIYEVADRDPESARTLWEKWGFCWQAKWREARSALDAYIREREAKQDPAKLKGFLQCFDGSGGPHDMCNNMVALPNALYMLLEEDQIDPNEAKAIIERVYPVLISWECRQQKADCKCYTRSERALVLLIVIMAQLDRERAESMIGSLPPQPIKISALKSVLHYTDPDDSLIERVVKYNQEIFTNPLDLAGSYYDLAANVLPSDERDWIARLIELAEPLVDDKAWPPPSAKLKLDRAKALIKLIECPEQFSYVEDAIAGVGSFDDMVKFLDILAEQARRWSREQRSTLLWQIWRLATVQRVEEVEALIASAVPVLESLVDNKGEVFWKLYDYVEWAYQELPRLNATQDGD
jgi:hypothetical protein